MQPARRHLLHALLWTSLALGCRPEGSERIGTRTAAAASPDCPAERPYDVCAGQSLETLIHDGCMAPQGGEVICSPQCESDPRTACNVFVVGATQDQCPPEPGCCMRTSSPEDDHSSESHVCSLASKGVSHETSCPSRTSSAGECGASPCQDSTTGQKVNWTCHSLGGAFCQCNMIKGTYIGTQCPTDSGRGDGNACPGNCCVWNAGTCNDPVGPCLNRYCNTGDLWESKQVGECISTCNESGPHYDADKCRQMIGDPPGGGTWNANCHNGIDYNTCFQAGLTQGACNIAPKACKAGDPQPSCTHGPNGQLLCNCGPDVPYCGDLETACCAYNACGANDGCGPCMTCKKNVSLPTGQPSATGVCVYDPAANPGPGQCVHPQIDWSESISEWHFWLTDLPPNCRWIAGGVECAHTCSCAPFNTGCPNQETVTYGSFLDSKTTTPCCAIDLCHGSEGFPCTAGGGCSPGLACDATNRCVACGKEGKLCCRLGSNATECDQLGGEPMLCNAQTRLCEPASHCTAGLRRCTAIGVEECRIGTWGITNWVTVASCRAFERCNPATLTCEAECTIGQQQCDGENIRLCTDPEHPHWATSFCPPSYPCQPDPAQPGKVTCGPACTPGDTGCSPDGSSVVPCRLNEEGFTTWDWISARLCALTETCQVDPATRQATCAPRFR